jgi:hypothetical protein
MLNGNNSSLDVDLLESRRRSLFHKGQNSFVVLHDKLPGIYAKHQNDQSDCVENNVETIGDSHLEKKRECKFKKDGPEREPSDALIKRRSFVVFSQF